MVHAGCRFFQRNSDDCNLFTNHLKQLWDSGIIPQERVAAARDGTSRIRVGLLVAGNDCTTGRYNSSDVYDIAVKLQQEYHEWGVDILIFDTIPDSYRSYGIDWWSSANWSEYYDQSDTKNWYTDEHHSYEWTNSNWYTDDAYPTTDNWCDNAYHSDKWSSTKWSREHAHPENDSWSNEEHQIQTMSRQHVATTDCDYTSIVFVDESSACDAQVELSTCQDDDPIDIVDTNTAVVDDAAPCDAQLESTTCQGEDPIDRLDKDTSVVDDTAACDAQPENDSLSHKEHQIRTMSRRHVTTNDCDDTAISVVDETATSDAQLEWTACQGVDTTDSVVPDTSVVDDAAPCDAQQDSSACGKFVWRQQRSIWSKFWIPCDTCSLMNLHAGGKKARARARSRSANKSGDETFCGHRVPCTGNVVSANGTVHTQEKRIQKRVDRIAEHNASPFVILHQKRAEADPEFKACTLQFPDPTDLNISKRQFEESVSAVLYRIRVQLDLPPPANSKKRSSRFGTTVSLTIAAVQANTITLEVQLNDRKENAFLRLGDMHWMMKPSETISQEYLPWNSSSISPGMSATLATG